MIYSLYEVNVFLLRLLIRALRPGNADRVECVENLLGVQRPPTLLGSLWGGAGSLS